MISFSDKVLLVTGGGTGIGRATCLLFAQNGADVVVNYSRSKEEAESVVAEIEKLGRRAVAICADISDESAVQSMFADTKSQFGRLDFLVNNAATTEMVPARQLDDLTDDIWNKILNVNVKGTFYCCRAGVPLLRDSGGGLIVNVSSISAITGLGSSIAYSASKAAISNMTMAMARAEGPDIRVNAVAPGVVMTRWVEGWETFIAPHREQTPLGRLAEPEDVANVIYGLAVSDFVTGHTVVVDGGRMLN